MTSLNSSMIYENCILINRLAYTMIYAQDLIYAQDPFTHAD